MFGQTLIYSVIRRLEIKPKVNHDNVGRSGPRREPLAPIDDDGVVVLVIRDEETSNQATILHKSTTLFSA